MKPGYKTTEFWVSLAVILLSTGAGILCVVYGKNAIEKAEALVPLVIAYLKAHGYNMGRVKQKIENIIKEQIGVGSSPVPTPPPVPTPLPPVPPTPLPTPTPDTSGTTAVTPDTSDDDSQKHSVSITTKITKNSTAITTTIK